jgi:hypothetical protein
VFGLAIMATLNRITQLFQSSGHKRSLSEGMDGPAVCFRKFVHDGIVGRRNHGKIF